MWLFKYAFFIKRAAKHTISSVY